MAKLETVLIEYGDGFLRINKTSFNPTIHRVYQGNLPDKIEETPLKPKPIEQTTILNLNTASISAIAKLPSLNISKAKELVKLRPIESYDSIPFEELGIDKSVLVGKVSLS